MHFYLPQDHHPCEEAAAADPNRPRSAGCSRQLCSQRIQCLEPPGTSNCLLWRCDPSRSSSNCCGSFLFSLSLFFLDAFILECLPLSLLYTFPPLSLICVSLCVCSAEDAVHPRPGHRLSVSIYGLQAAAPAQCCIHLGVPIQILSTWHVHLQSAIQSWGMHPCEHALH